MRVIRSSDLPCRVIAARYSSQSGCSPLIDAVVLDERLERVGQVEHLGGAVDLDPGAVKSSESTQSETGGSRRALGVFARCG